MAEWKEVDSALADDLLQWMCDPFNKTGPGADDDDGGPRANAHYTALLAAVKKAGNIDGSYMSSAWALEREYVSDSPVLAGLGPKRIKTVNAVEAFKFDVDLWVCCTIYRNHDVKVYTFIKSGDKVYMIMIE